MLLSRCLILLFCTVLNLSLSPDISSHDSQSSLQALKTISSIIGLPPDPDLMSKIEAFASLPPEPDAERIRSLIEEQQMPQWSSHLKETQGLAALIFADMALSPEDQHRFVQAMQVLDWQGQAMNAYARNIHPGLKYLGAADISAAYKGRGIRVAVFDLFDETLLAKQRAAYPKAVIHTPLSFGRPVALDHGHSVIDQLLTLAPELEILPIASDAAHYAEAIFYLLDRPDIDLVNISRALAPGPDPKRLDPIFATAFRRLIRGKIVCKSLGNTGTDLSGKPNPRREAEGLGPVANLFAYDLALIQDLYDSGEEAQDDLLFFGLNLNVFADRIARTATVPGDFAPVVKRTLGAPAEGVWSAATETFESGSSFAAPQICGLSALLLEAQRLLTPAQSQDQNLAAVRDALLSSASLGRLEPASGGRGLPSPAKALVQLKEGSPSR